MNNKINNIIMSKLKQRVGLPEIKIALELAGYEMSIQELILKVNELEK